MKYFAKYLPVKGEIKEGDKFFSKYIFGELVTLNSSTPIHTCHWIQKDMKVDNITTDGLYLQPKEDESEAMSWRTASQKVKLFLCSRNIQVGDKLTAINEAPLAGIIYKIEDGKIYIDMSDGNRGLLYGKELEEDFGDPENLSHWSKMVGEISREATWVKEGDEFDQDELALNGIWQNWDSTTSLSGKNIVFIKGPCGHFH